MKWRLLELAKLNKEYALSCKGILDFGGLGLDGKELGFSDIDGIHTTDRTKIIIEEKFHWRSYTGETKFLSNEIENDKRPAILLLTQNPVDISNKPFEEKIIPMEQSKVVESYDNTNGAFRAFLRRLRIDIRTLYGKEGINTFLHYWFIFLDRYRQN